jgi:hypothetical protein
LTRLVVEDAQVRTRAFLRAHRDALAAHSSGLIEFLSSWCEAETTSVSRSEASGLPLANASFRHPSVDPVWAAASAALHLVHSGRAGSWRATFDTARSVRHGTSLSAPLSSVECEAGSVAPSAQAGRLSSISVGAGELAILGPSTRSAVPVITGEISAVAVVDSPLDVGDVSHALGRSLGLIGRHASEYTGWIGEVVHGVIPTRAAAGTATSGSEPGHRGLIHLSFPCPDLAAAEGLIHEASHQYVYFAECETLLANGEDHQRYVSPYSGMERTIDRVLLGFHAFANISFMFQALSEADVRGAEDELAAHRKYLPFFVRALERSRGLTADGRELFNTVRERLRI